MQFDWLLSSLYLLADWFADELALVQAARKLGFEFTTRTPNGVAINVVSNLQLYYREAVAC